MSVGNKQLPGGYMKKSFLKSVALILVASFMVSGAFAASKKK